MASTNETTPWTDLLGKLTREDRQHLESAAIHASGDDTQYLTEVRRIASERGITLNDAFRNEALAWREHITKTNDFQPQQEQDKDLQKSGVENFFDKLNNSSSPQGGPTGTAARDAANKQLFTIQERKLFAEFDHLVATTPPEQLPEAIKAFCEHHFEIGEMMRRESDILTRSMSSMGYGEMHEGWKSFQQERSERLAYERKLRGKPENELTKAEREYLERRKKQEAETQERLLQAARESSPKKRGRAFNDAFAGEWESYDAGIYGIKRHFNKLTFTDLGRQLERESTQDHVEEYEYLDEGGEVQAATVQQDFSYSDSPPDINPESINHLPPQQKEALLRSRGIRLPKRGGARQSIENANRALNAAGNAGRLAGGAGETAEAGEAALTATEVSSEGALVGWIIFWVILAIIVIGLVVVVFNFLSQSNQNSAAQQQYQTTGIVQNAQLISTTLCRENMNFSNPYDPCVFGGGLLDNFNPNWKLDGQPSANPPWDPNKFLSPAFSIKIGAWSVHNRPNRQANYVLCKGPGGHGLCTTVDWIPWGKFWCTDMVINSYAGAGFTDMVHWVAPDGGSVWNVPDMIRFFKTYKGYTFVPRNQFNPNTLLPGAAVFFTWHPSDPTDFGDHTAVITAIHPNQALKLLNIWSGTIDFIQANGRSRKGSIWYRNGNLESDVMGFGLKLAQ